MFDEYSMTNAFELTLLVHIGYLGYDSLTGEVFVPNKEVSDEFINATRTGNREETAAR